MKQNTTSVTASGWNWRKCNIINTIYTFPNWEMFRNVACDYMLIIYLCVCVCLQGQYRKALSSLHQMAAVQQPQPGQQSPSGQASLEHHRALIQQASCHYALGEYRVHTHTLTHTNTLLYIRLVGVRRHAYTNTGCSSFFHSFFHSPLFKIYCVYCCMMLSLLQHIEICDLQTLLDNPTSGDICCSNVVYTVIVVLLSTYSNICWSYSTKT